MLTAAPSQMSYAQSIGLDPKRMPRHVSLVMDGNGRWARARMWDRTFGHQQGAETVRAITTDSVKLGIERLTLYAFSSENWSRPQREVDFLMNLLERFLLGELTTLMDNGVRLEAIGRLHRLPERVQQVLQHIMTATAQNKAMVLSLALSYGGRDELVDACTAIARAVAAGRIQPDAVDEAMIQAHLYAPGAPDVDVVIRTAGEQRMSNFMPWQATYAEYIPAQPLWPDFTVAHYHAALKEFQGRERRFGNV